MLERATAKVRQFASAIACAVALLPSPLNASDSANEPSARSAIIDRIRAASLDDIAGDDQLLAYARAKGRAAYQARCAECHGPRGRGSIGNPDLTDRDWLWGGTLSAIDETNRVGIRSGDDLARESEMPAFLEKELLTKVQISDVAAFVMSFTKRGSDPAAAKRGALLFDKRCTGCHGENGRGNRAFGAPNLRDTIWLYGGKRSDIIRTVSHGRRGEMPGFEDRLDDATLKLLAVYVHSLGGGETDQ